MKTRLLLAVPAVFAVLLWGVAPVGAQGPFHQGAFPGLEKSSGSHRAQCPANSNPHSKGDCQSRHGQLSSDGLSYACGFPTIPHSDCTPPPIDYRPPVATGHNEHPPGDPYWRERELDKKEKRLARDERYVLNWEGELLQREDKVERVEADWQALLAACLFGLWIGGCIAAAIAGWAIKYDPEKKTAEKIRNWWFFAPWATLLTLWACNAIAGYII